MILLRTFSQQVTRMSPLPNILTLLKLHRSTNGLTEEELELIASRASVVTFDADSHLHSIENPFTEREIEVIKEIHKGGSNHDIANRLFISRHTVATHRKNIFRKCNCNNILDLLVYCKKLEIL